MLVPEIVMDKDPLPIPALEKREHLLVVDDDAAIRKILSRMLSLMGYDVTLADNGLEAMALFVTGAYDLVISDFQMPLMNGWELSRLVKDQSPGTPVIVVTGLCDDKDWEKLKVNGVDAIILKPFKLKEIDQTVKRLLNSGI